MADKETYTGTLEWTSDRIDELEQLRRMLIDLESLNDGNLFLDKVQRCMKIAKKLRDTNRSMRRRSFITWLEDSWQRECMKKKEAL